MTQRDGPAIIAPPPLLYLAALALLIGLHWLRPLPLPAYPAIAWLGWVALIAGLALNLWGAWSMRRAGTPINPHRHANTIVAAGAFRVSRNPLYVGLDLVFLGVVLALSSLWGIVILVVLLVVMHIGVIRPEERYLKTHFGDEYRCYCTQVRRYL